MKNIYFALFLLLVFSLNAVSQEDDVYYTPSKDSSQFIQLDYQYYSIQKGETTNIIESGIACLEIKHKRNTIARLHEGATLLYLTKNDIIDPDNPEFFVGTISAFENDSLYIIHLDNNVYKEFSLAVSDLTLVGYSDNPNDFNIKEGGKPYKNIKKIELKNNHTASVLYAKSKTEFLNNPIVEFFAPVIMQILLEVIVLAIYSISL